MTLPGRFDLNITCNIIGCVFVNIIFTFHIKGGYILGRTMVILLLLMIACEGQLSSGDGGVSSDTSPEHQSMMDEINKLHEDVADLNEELGKKIYLRKSAEHFFTNPEINCYTNISRHHSI